MQARLFDSLTETCNLCARRCVIPNGKRGFCNVRENVSGNLLTLTYGKVTACGLDPVEKSLLIIFCLQRRLCQSAVSVVILRVCIARIILCLRSSGMMLFVLSLKILCLLLCSPGRRVFLLLTMSRLCFMSSCMMSQSLQKMRG